MAESVQYYGTGRRKSAIARVYLRPGSGDFKVNGRPFEQYFVTESQRSSAKQPLLSTETAATFNVLARVSGGGVNGQADAVKLGIARALMLFNIELRKKAIFWLGQRDDPRVRKLLEELINNDSI